MCPVTIFTTFPRCFEAKNLFHQTTRRVTQSPRVQNARTKKGTQKKRKYSLCKKKTLAFLETFLVHLHRAVVNQDNQEI